MTAPVSQVLSEAADLLEKPGAWIQERLAADANGLEVLPKDDTAMCWCMEGAIDKVRPIGLGHEFYKAVRRELGVPFIHAWNDDPERTQTQVVDALRRAAALAKEQGR